VADDLCGGVAELDFDKVRGGPRHFHTYIGERPAVAQGDLFPDPYGFWRETVLLDVLKPAKVAAYLFKEEAQLSKVALVIMLDYHKASSPARPIYSDGAELSIIPSNKR
jgi:hypothetical protein